MGLGVWRNAKGPVWEDRWGLTRLCDGDVVMDGWEADAPHEWNGTQARAGSEKGSKPKLSWEMK